jgi:hypothetical protein
MVPAMNEERHAVDRELRFELALKTPRSCRLYTGNSLGFCRASPRGVEPLSVERSEVALASKPQVLSRSEMLSNLA